MNGVKNISGAQFAVFRVIFGIYLAVHFAQLLPHAAELFSREGMLPDPRLNFTHGLLPNPLEHWDSPAAARAFVGALLLVALLFAAGIARRSAALLLWFGWACLFNRNNLISNPSIPYVGLLLLFCALLPAGESGKNARWEFPIWIWRAAWALLVIGYAFSGWAKLHSPSWIDGSALGHVLDNPLARPGLARDMMLSLPDFALPALTWGTLALELLCLPMSLHRVTRPLAWLAMTALHAGIVACVDFADLSFGMLMFHLFLFDPDWLLIFHKMPSAGRNACGSAANVKECAEATSRASLQ